MTYQRLLGADRPKSRNSNSDPEFTSIERTEGQVRQALSRLGKAEAPGGHQQPRHTNRPRHHFVRDGEVPVVVLNRQHDRRERTADAATVSHQPAENRLEAVEAMLRQEQTAREQAERALRDAQTTIRDLQTKLGHAVLARDEALKAVQAAEARRAAEHQQPVSAPAAASGGPRRRGRPPGSSRKAVENGPLRAPEQTKHKEPLSSASSQSAAARDKRGIRPRKTKQKPVKWWVEGWQSEFGF